MSKFKGGMGGGMGSMGNMQQMMKQAQKMQADMKKMQEELDQKEVEATSGGGVVKVVMSGKKEVKSIEIKKEAVDPNDVEMLQDLIMTAVNEAIRLIEDMNSKEMGKITGGMNLGGII